MEVCSECGSQLQYKTVDAGTFEEPNATAQIAVSCLNPKCEYSNPNLVVFGWTKEV